MGDKRGRCKENETDARSLDAFHDWCSQLHWTAVLHDGTPHSDSNHVTQVCCFTSIRAKSFATYVVTARECETQSHSSVNLFCRVVTFGDAGLIECGVQLYSLFLSSFGGSAEPGGSAGASQVVSLDGHGIFHLNGFGDVPSLHCSLWRSDEGAS